MAEAPSEKDEARCRPEKPPLVTIRHWPADQEPEPPSELVTLGTARAAASAVARLGLQGFRQGLGGIVEVEVGERAARQAVGVGQAGVGVFRREPGHGHARGPPAWRGPRR